MVRIKDSFVVFAALVAVSFMCFGVVIAGGGGDYEIMGPGVSVYITNPVNGADYNYFVSNFSWDISPWSNFSSCWYTLNGGSNNFVNCADNFSSFPALSDGNYNLLFVVNKSITQVWSDAISFTVDTTPPLYSSPSTTPANPATYAPGQDYDFYMTWDGTESSVWYEFDGVTYYDTFNGGGAWYFQKSDLAAGSYNYRWYANDSLGNVNQSIVYTYVVDKASPAAGMAIAGTTPIVYGTTSDFSGSETNANDGGCDYSLSPSNAVFGAGTTTFVFSTVGCANYSAGSVNRDLTVLKATPVLTFLANNGSENLTLVYGDNLNMSASSSVSELIVGLDRDGTSVVSENSLDVILGGSTSYVYRANITGNENWTDVGYRYLNITVMQAAPSLSLTISPSNSVYSGTETSATGVCPSQLNCTLFRDDVAVLNPEVITLSAGTYNYSYNTTGNENYSASQVSAILSVTNAPSGGGGGSHSSSAHCYSNWTCTDWSECDKGLQNRTCELIDSACMPTGSEPSESQSCVVASNSAAVNESVPEVKATKIMDESVGEEPVSGNAGITGGVIGALPGGGFTLVILLMAGIAIAYGYIVLRKKMFRTALEKTLWQASSTASSPANK